jgi:PAT family beta-lactamase induction signal transducer AmpG
MQNSAKSSWWWIPSLYFGQGIPYAVVMTMSLVMYKNMHVSNTDIALYTSWLSLPWVIKPLWGPFVDMFKTKRFWILAMQFFIGVAFALVALTIPTDRFFQMTLAVFWLMAFSSATHDIAADGFYMLGLKEHEQAAFVGVRSTFYRVANIAGQGALVWLAGWLTQSTGSVQVAWTVVFVVLSGMFISLALYHRFVLPMPAADSARAPVANPVREYFQVFGKFFGNKKILTILTFFLLYRFGEAQLLKMAIPFMLDPASEGGLGLTTQQVGIVYGTIGMAALTVGGILGGLAISRFGLKTMLWPMALSLNVPHVVYVYLAFDLPTNIWLIGTAVAVEQLGYGFGFAAYLLYMIMVSDGPHKTAHYALCTGFMALGMMLPGMWSGYLQSQLGYANFFVWICLAAGPAFVATALVRGQISSEFGRKRDNPAG